MSSSRMIRQCVVACLPSKSPCSANTNAPLHTLLIGFVAFMKPADRPSRAIPSVLTAREANQGQNDEEVQQGFLYRRWLNNIGEGIPLDRRRPLTWLWEAPEPGCLRILPQILISAGTACRFTVRVAQITWVQCSVVWKGKGGAVRAHYRYDAYLSQGV